MRISDWSSDVCSSDLHGDPHDPLLRQVLPLDEELRPVPGFSPDAVGDAAARAGHGVIHKYEGRALLVATGSCAVNGRYCFRRHFPYAEETAKSEERRVGQGGLRTFKKRRYQNN